MSNPPTQPEKADRSKHKKPHQGAAQLAGAATNNGNTGELYDVYRFLNQFWPCQQEKIDKMSPVEFRDSRLTQELPLARIKKIMKLDDDVKQQMISAEAPVLFAKACEIFIEELTVRAWVHTEDNKRKTLQKNDIAMAIARHDQFDFLIDIVPREEITKGASTAVPPSTTKRTADHHSNVNESQTSVMTAMEQHMPVFVQMAAPSSTAGPSSAVHAVQLPNGQVVQAQTCGQPLQLIQGPNGELQIVGLSGGGSQTAQIVHATSSTHHNQQQEQPHVASPPLPQAFQQIVGQDGSVHQVPIQLSPAQLSFLQKHLGGGGAHQIQIVQATPSAPARAQQQPAAFFLQTSGPVGQQQQLHLISADQQQQVLDGASTTTS